MRVLVTGGAGFIGSHVVDRLLSAGHQPRIYDLVPSPYHSPEKVDAFLGSVTDPEALELAMENCEAVIHLAAMADVGEVQADPAHSEHVNTRGTLAVLEAARRSELGRVVYGSTIWVYSDCTETRVDEDTRPAPPAHIYTATKLAGELYCRSYSELYGIEYTVLRFGVPYGPRAREAAVLPIFVNKALAGQALTVAGSGDQSRRFVYVEDLADGVVRALAAVAANRIYNLSGDEDVTVKQIAELVRDTVGRGEVVHTPARAGDFGGKEVSSERARRELDWNASTPYAEGVRRYVHWRRAGEEAATGGRPAAPRRRRRRGWLPAWRVRPALSLAMASAAFVWSFATDDSFGLFARAFDAEPVTALASAGSGSRVGLLIDAPASLVPQVTSELDRNHQHASLSLVGKPRASTVSRVLDHGDEALPRLKPGGPVRWVRTGSQLKGAARSMGLSGHVYYAAPGRGFTFGQYLLARTAGATRVAGAVQFRRGSSLGSLHTGELIEVSLGGSPAASRALLGSLLAQLSDRGFRATSVGALVRARQPRA